MIWHSSLKAKHVMSNEKAVEEYERQREQRAVAKNAGESRRRLKVEISDVGHQDGDSLTRKRNAIASSDPRKRSSESNAHVLARRPIRRRNNSLINQLESALPNKGERICPPNQIQRHVKPAPISCEYRNYRWSCFQESRAQSVIKTVINFSGGFSLMRSKEKSHRKRISSRLSMRFFFQYYMPESVRKVGRSFCYSPWDCALV